jgi:hypothetical protein
VAAGTSLQPSEKVNSSTTDSEKPLSIYDIAQFNRNYGWTPPLGFTQSQLTQFMKDNPNASPQELEAGAKQALQGTQENKTSFTAERNTIDGITERIKLAKDNEFSDEEIKTTIKESYTSDELFALAESAGYAKWYTGKDTDIERMLDAILNK